MADSKPAALLLRGPLALRDGFFCGARLPNLITRWSRARLGAQQVLQPHPLTAQLDATSHLLVGGRSPLKSGYRAMQGDQQVLILLTRAFV